ncbi:hypothetical protein F0562_031072 [Nyssa sinensis]|uniref:Sulfotransferase n=1 Tax=Nyssa sinensis TaxID=561372 RepID=A0A5J5AT93_9ASTE|nr:hypothetical protein F0562_031072 [Nyssa sinensis]
MAISPLHSQQCFKTDANKKDHEEDNNEYKETCQKYTEILPSLPKENGWITKYVVKYQDTWLSPSVLQGVMLVQEHFIAQPTDILLASLPKSGTTWLKALIFTTINRKRFDFQTHPLLTSGPHACIPSLEALMLQNNQNSSLDLPSPRLFATHIPHHLLPVSLKSSGCRIVYVLRNPKDVFVSSWYHMKKLRLKELPPLSLEEGVDMYCKGVYHFGPYWDHVLGYWNASLESPNKVLILTYEDMKKDILTCVKSLAEFLGQPFSLEEERDGVVQEIIKLCSFDNLSNLEVNKTGVQQFTPKIAIENNVFFRKGEVGDWKNHLTDEMVERLAQISEMKFSGTTWLKALLFTIMNRKTFHFSKHPLLSNSPQACIPFIEALILQNPNISSLSLPSPRLLSTHIPCTLLPPSVRSSGCQIVYLFRNPKDVFISIWHYFQKLRPKELPPLSLEEGVDMFCKGIYQNGPFWDHALGYWSASLESPEKVLFLSFEDMKKDPLPGVKRLAEFLGQPFSLEEERDGIVEETIKLCSFENLSNLEVNKTGVHQYTPNIVIENHVFFRKGEVGDWKNHLTEEMVERLNQVTEQKFCGTGLMSHISP